jgi:hypothetical protein
VALVERSPPSYPGPPLQLNQPGVRLALWVPALLRSGKEPIPCEDLALHILEHQHVIPLADDLARGCRPVMLWLACAVEDPTPLHNARHGAGEALDTGIMAHSSATFPPAPHVAVDVRRSPL